jgi:hypothetical protein
MTLKMAMEKAAGAMKAIEKACKNGAKAIELLEKTTARQTGKGTAPKNRPPGRAPKGKEWDSERRAWVWSSAALGDANAKKRPAGRAPKGTTWDKAQGSWVLIADSEAGAPKAAMIARPRGRPPKGKTWDPVQGIWRWSTNPPLEQGASKKRKRARQASEAGDEEGEGCEGED